MEFQVQNPQGSLPKYPTSIIRSKAKTPNQVCTRVTTKAGDSRSSLAPERQRPLFLMKKETGDLRPVLDLKNLNRTILVESFKMESLQFILLAINTKDWMLLMDLSNAYLHIPIHPGFQKYLRFAVGQQHFQYQSLPFGISMAPRMFTKILLPMIAYLREKGLRVHHYLNDILLLANSQQLLLQHRGILISTLHQFGWIINWNKSSLEPTQSMIFLGAELDTNANKVVLPQGKIGQLVQKIRRLMEATHLSSRTCLSILGSMSATFPMIRWSQWHMRTFQISFLK